MLLIIWLLSGCRLDMQDQPRVEAFEESALFADGSAARPRVNDTVSRNQVPASSLLMSGRENGAMAEGFPVPITRELLARGQERYAIFCTPCHGLSGDGTGVIIEYGMRQPPSFHDPELISEPNGYYFTIITDGTRVMPSLAAQIPPADRWAIVAYVRALQLSQNVDIDQLSTEDLTELNNAQ